MSIELIAMGDRPSAGYSGATDALGMQILDAIVVADGQDFLIETPGLYRIRATTDCRVRTWTGSFKPDIAKGMLLVAGEKEIFALAKNVMVSCVAASQVSVKYATIFIDNGNSHKGGRVTALKTEPRDERIMQWTQAGALERLADTSRYTFDQQPFGSFDPATQISPTLWFMNTFIANEGMGESDIVVVVPHAKAATGFSDGTWTAGGAPSNSLGVSVVRANAAIAALKAQGYTIKEIVLCHHSANPDYTGAAWDARRADIDAMIAYVRANVTPADVLATIPVIIGAGMGKAELDAQSDIRNRLYQANFASSEMRNLHTAVMDHVNARYGRSAGVPVGLLGDGIHEDYAGLQTMGAIYYESLLRARSINNARGALASLSFLASSVRMWDFRTGGIANMHGATGLLTRLSDSQPPAFEFDPELDAYAMTRLAAGTTSGSLPVLSNATLPASYTKYIFIKPASVEASMGFISDTDSSGPNQHRLFYSQPNNDIRAGHGSNQTDAVIPNVRSLFLPDKYHLVALRYDAGTMKLSLNEAVTTATGIAAHAATRIGFVGASTAIGGLGFNGRIAQAGVITGALSDAQLAEMLAASRAQLKVL